MTRRPFTVERRPLALRDAPGYLRRRMLAGEVETADLSRKDRGQPESVAGNITRNIPRPLLAEIRDLFRRSPERCPKPLYETRA